MLNCSGKSLQQLNNTIFWNPAETDCCDVVVCLFSAHVALAARPCLFIFFFVLLLRAVSTSHLFPTATEHLTSHSEMNRTKSNIYWIKNFPFAVFVVTAAREVVRLAPFALALMVATLQLWKHMAVILSQIMEARVNKKQNDKDSAV